MNISGPMFLLVYLLIAIAANVWLRRYFRAQESDGHLPRLEFSEDPYRVACLREGEGEAVNLAVFSLIDRGILNEQAGQLVQARTDAPELVRRRLEQAVVQAARSVVTLPEIQNDPDVRLAAREYVADLESRRLLTGASIRSARFPAFLAVLALTLGVAGLRIWQALAHGRSNIGFLIILSLACAIGLLVAYRRRITGLGQATLDKLEMLFARLQRNRASILPGGQSNEAVLLAAVFGFSALPADQFPYARRLFAKSSSGDSGGGGDGGDGGGDGGGSGCGGCGGGGCG